MNPASFEHSSVTAFPMSAGVPSRRIGVSPASDDRGSSAAPLLATRCARCSGFVYCSPLRGSPGGFAADG
jgi:hypothetical protein